VDAAEQEEEHLYHEGHQSCLESLGYPEPAPDQPAQVEEVDQQEAEEDGGHEGGGQVGESVLVLPGFLLQYAAFGYPAVRITWALLSAL